MGYADVEASCKCSGKEFAIGGLCRELEYLAREDPGELTRGCGWKVALSLCVLFDDGYRYGNHN
jgi:hypothetical protein